MVDAIVTKTGNSYALRVPKRYIDDNKLKLGDKVKVDGPMDRQRRAIDKIVRRAYLDGPIAGIKDPVAWQRQQRISSDPWDEVNR